jgi:hypothetical protein
MNQIGINPDFFRRALKDYSQWQWAWVRELCQNSIDCGASVIRFDIKQEGDGVVAVCSNDGPPMSREVLLDKFLNLGGTTKTFDGQVGGFGLAKVVICFAHDRYRIETGDLTVSGSGGSYEITDSTQHFAGTKTTVLMSDTGADEIEHQVFLFASFLQFKGQIILNGFPLNCNLKKGSPRRQFPFGRVFTNNTHPGKMIIRIGGIPMFYDYIDAEKCIVVELEGRSDQLLTSNRDALNHPHNRTLSSFVRELTVDKASALRDRSQTEIEEYYGSKIIHIGSKKQADSQPEQILAAGPLVSIASESEPDAVNKRPSLILDVLAAHRTVAEPPKASWKVPSPIKTNFLTKNTTGLKIPQCYLPPNGSANRWSSYSDTLARCWGNVLFELHKQFDICVPFSVGFIFDADTLAQYSECGNHGTVYYIAPAVLKKQDDSNSRSFKKAWSFDAKGKGAIIATAAHELVHGMGHRYHDETFASVYTQVMGQVLAAKADFHWCFR